MDMNQCLIGEKLLLRNGETATYISKFNDNVINPHIIMLDDTKNEVYRTDEGYMISGQTNDRDVVSILDIRSLLKEAFDAGCEYVGERNFIDSKSYMDFEHNFIDSEGYMDFHKDDEIEAPNFDEWIKNNAFKINKIV